MQNGTYSLSFVTNILRSDLQSQDGDRDFKFCPNKMPNLCYMRKGLKLRQLPVFFLLIWGTQVWCRVVQFRAASCSLEHFGADLRII